MARVNKIPLLYTSILYLCGFFLFLEWLYPLSEFTNIKNLSIFIIYAAVCFLVSTFNLQWWISLIIKGGGLLFIISTLFTSDPSWGYFDFQGLYTEISINIKMLFTGSWYQITDIFRSILFLLLIWMISYLVYYWFVIMKQIFLFILLTFIYITLLDTFTLYDASFAIVRVFTISFIALGMANFFKEIHQYQIQFSWWKNAKVWILPIAAIVLFTSLIGYAAPKYGPQWPDPVPFFQGITDSSNSGMGSETSRSGYGTDDSHLGGSFTQDDSIVFHATVKHREYWRIETKDIYTGKGWESTPSKSDYELEDELTTTFTGNVVTEDHEALIDFKGKVEIDKLVYPYGLTHVEVLEGQDLLMDPLTGAIQKQGKNNQLNKEKYELTYRKPFFDLDTLRTGNEEESSAIYDQYTKVPETTPDRIGDLAEEITASATNRYEQAYQIEQYFGKNGFVYETDNVPYPADDQDYVDQFLFETQAGYCDNYSTAMVVMLRALDIPARWVKGFTGGEKIANTLEADELYDIYEVTNANAHSWVEVYFPEVGWVPFEPTQGFSNPIDFVEISEEVEEQIEEENVEEEPESLEQETPTNEEQNEEEIASVQDEVIETKVNWSYVMIGITLFILTSFIIIYLTRFRWQPALLYAKLRKRQDYEAYEEAYHYLLAQLRHKGIKKDSSQSLREYAIYVDEKFNTNEMGILTSYYEKLLYNKQIKLNKDHEWIELWKNFIKHIQKNPSEKG